MAPPVTENAIIPLKPDIDLTSGSAAATWRSTLDTIAVQPGLQRIAWGRALEDPNTLQMLIDWDSVASHHAFATSPAYGPFLDRLKHDLLAAPPRLTHHAFPVGAALAPLTTDAPVTELVSFYTLETYDTASFLTPWNDFARVAAEHAKGLLGSAGAWADEKDEVEHASLRKDRGSGKGKLFLAVIAWESVEAHMAYRETPAFKESIVKLRALVSGIEMHHVDFKLA